MDAVVVLGLWLVAAGAAAVWLTFLRRCVVWQLHWGTTRQRDSPRLYWVPMVLHAGVVIALAAIAVLMTCVALRPR